MGSEDVADIRRASMIRAKDLHLSRSDHGLDGLDGLSRRWASIVSKMSLIWMLVRSPFSFQMV